MKFWLFYKNIIKKTLKLYLKYNKFSLKYNQRAYNKFMKVVDRINEILKEKKMSKKELVERLINLDMKTNKTGEVPAKSSFYAYLNGKIELKADMVPFIAEALGVFEQELFINDKEKSTKAIKKLYEKEYKDNDYKKIIDLLDYLSPKSLQTLENALSQNRQRISEFNSVLMRLG